MIGRLTISPENIRALQQAIEQLQVQNGAMRDALAKAREAGKTVFLSREEAEKAKCAYLEKQQGKIGG